MFTRITWFQSSPDRVDQGITQFRERAAPALMAMQGNQGAVLLINRGSGAGLAISYWDTMENLQASETAASTLRSQSASESGLTMGEVDRFEQLLQERMGTPQPNRFIRLNDLTGSPDKIDDVAGLVREAVPTLKTQKGFRALIMGVNRETGRILISSVWETAADRDASNSAVQARRDEIARVAGATVKVDNYESVFTEIKLPAPA